MSNKFQVVRTEKFKRLMKVSRESTFRFEASFDSPDGKLLEPLLRFSASSAVSELLTVTMQVHVRKLNSHLPRTIRSP